MSVKLDVTENLIAGSKYVVKLKNIYMNEEYALMALAPVNLQHEEDSYDTR